MKIVGLDKYICTPKGVPFTSDGANALFGDSMYELAARAWQGQSDEQKMLGYRICKKLALPSTEIDLSAEEISLLKTVAVKTAPPLFCGAISFCPAIVFIIP